MPRPFPRKGAWAILDTRVGIISNIEDGLAEVHFTNELGETTIAADGIPAAALTQAHYEDIPVPRRPEPAIATQLGYLVDGA